MFDHSSPSRVAGKACRSFEHNGQTLHLSEPLHVSSYAEEEAIVLWKRRDPGEFAIRMIQRLPANYHAGVWEGAAAANMRGIPSPEEWSAYNQSSWKDAFMFWNTLDIQHKTDRNTKGPISLIDGVQWALEFISTLPPEKLMELQLKIKIVSQEAALKNSSGRTAQPAAPASPQTDIPDTQDGQPYMNTSQNDTTFAPET